MLQKTHVGELIRLWRTRRRMSQLDLALDADISTRHLSFIETGRSNPSRETLLKLAEGLSLPLRERNDLLNAAGFAAAFALKESDAEGLELARAAIAMILKGHEPFPALAIDRHWTITATNAAVAPLLAGLPPALLDQPNALRLSLHPQGLAPRIVNFSEWRAHILHRLRDQVRLTADPALQGLYEEALAYPAPPGGPAPAHAGRLPVIPLRLRHGDTVLSLITTTTVFGTPVEVGVSELAIETFFPADDLTRAILLGATG